MEVAIVNFDAGINMYQDTSLFFKRVLELGHEVTLLGCDKGLNRCTTIISRGTNINDAWLLENKKSICRRCKNGQARLADKSSFYLDPFQDGINAVQHRIVEGLTAQQFESASTLLAVEYDGAPLGRLAFFDFAMRNKLSHRTILNTDQVADFIEHLKDVFCVWNFIDRVLHNKNFDSVIYVNGNYSLNAVVRERMNRAGVKCWSVEYSWANSEMEKRIYLERDRLEHCRDWPGLANVQSKYFCNLRDGKTAINGLRNRIYGVDFNSYSSPVRTESWDRFDQFKGRYKELVSIFVSSGDELLTHEAVYTFVQDTRFFKDQSEWLRFLIANANPEVGYVVRLHPRLKPNKRDSMQAEEYFRLSEELEAARGMPNFLIVEADDSISSYYVLLHSVLSVVSWSMMALESVALNIPTIVCFPKNMSFPIETMGPLPGDLADIRSYFKREKMPTRTQQHDVAMMKWLSIIYSGIGLKIPGIRYAKNNAVRIWFLVQRFILSSKFLFSIFFNKHYQNRLITSPDGDIRLIMDVDLKNEDQTAECLRELQKFRHEARVYYQVI